MPRTKLRRRNGRRRASYEIEAGKLVRVPSCWNLPQARVDIFRGAAWYTRDLDWTPGAPGDVRVPAARRCDLLQPAWSSSTDASSVVMRGEIDPVFSWSYAGQLEPESNRLQIR